MAKETSPAFQFYPKEFLADGNVSGMSLSERGAYITLICICWNDGSLPVAHDRLANMVGLPVRQFHKLWPALRACFKEQDGRLIHPRLEREREKQEQFRRRQSDKGANGAAARWRKAMAQASSGHAPAMAQASSGHALGNAQAMPGDSSPISISPISNLPTSTAASSTAFPSRKAQPLPHYQRLRIFPWMLHDLIAMLGAQADAFDLDAYLLRLDTNGDILPAKQWPWLKEQVEAEARRRGLLVLPVPAMGKQTTRLAAALANIRAQEGV